MTLRVALDANRLTDLFRGDSALATRLGTCHEVWIPVFVLGEIQAGFRGGTKQRQNQELLQNLLSLSTVDVLLPSRETANHYARLFIQLKRAGTPIPVNDLWIAALAIEHNLTLITRDEHFAKIPQLSRE